MTRKELLLTQLSEECGEVVQVVSKSLRFGLDDYHEIPPANKEKLHAELTDLIGIYEPLVDEGIIPCITQEGIENKKIKVEKYLLHSQKLGILKEE